ncbi:MAG: Holliday junction branch migration protein RuvA [Acidimicrobiales bacterium]|nr:Holliday junction branch migration protein RuvA [Acidimicrobiales bacterium]
MIGSLRGYITHIDRDRHELLIELASGIGYRVAVNDRTLNQIDLEGETLLYTHHQFIREGEQKLIGFCTQSEVATLETLVATPKVGPALALSILNTYGPAELAAIVGSDDIAALQAVNGVGKTTAQRVLVEMKDKLVVDLSSPDTATIGGGLTSVGNDGVADVIDALLTLGYSMTDAKTAASLLSGELIDEGDTGAMLKEALKQMEPSF